MHPPYTLVVYRHSLVVGLEWICTCAGELARQSHKLTLVFSMLIVLCDHVMLCKTSMFRVIFLTIWFTNNPLIHAAKHPGMPFFSFYWFFVAFSCSGWKFCSPNENQVSLNLSSSPILCASLSKNTFSLSNWLKLKIFFSTNDYVTFEFLGAHNKYERNSVCLHEWSDKILK